MGVFVIKNGIYVTRGREIARLFRSLSRAFLLVLIVEKVEQVKEVLHVRQERKEIRSLSGNRTRIKQAKLTNLASIRILDLVILEYTF